MRKILSLIFAAVLIIAAAGCRNAETPVESSLYSETLGTSVAEGTEPASTSGSQSGEIPSADVTSEKITTAEEPADGTTAEDLPATEESTVPGGTTVHEHTVGVDKKREPTCTEPGLTEGRHCSECGEVIEKQQQIPAKGHNFVDTVVEPTTSAKGYTEHVCAECGYSYKDNYTDKLLYDETTLQSFGLGFVLKSREDREICDGVTFSVMNFEDRDGIMHVAYVVTASPDSVSLEMGLPGSTGQLNGLATVYDQTVTAERVLGYDIIASINADLFGATVAGMPNGTTILNGELLYRDTVGYQGFAVMNDGSYWFSYNATEFANQADNIRFSCGGRYLVLKKGKIVNNGTADAFCTIHHPRTAFGVKKDGTMIFAVVDGRQSGYSDGATLLDLSVLFYRLGAVNAINLDGGGSTNLFLKDAQTGDFVCANRPWEADRRVVNTLFFVKKR
ncbi:MAG: phosphodiester glycosidase family protein [Clostridia bacterium]|nr:phosphodiester glycosidase family protein [Clostridia bacterium]